MNEGQNIRVRLEIRGRVQGVWFRASAREAAQGLGLRGWVANRPGGWVEAVAEGPEDAVERFIRWCGEGPPLGRVEDVRTDHGPATGEFSSFEVR